ncbi:MAG: Hsp20/alpha crystallin family protein [Pseudomonadota bacterium]
MTQSWLPDLFGRDRKDDPFHTLRNEIERVFDEFPKAWGLPAGNGMLTPSLDVAETEEAIRITTELPGVEQKDIDVTLANDVLTIKGEKKSEHEEKGETFHRSERSYGMFQRSIAVPSGLDPAAVKAVMKDGVLEVTLPKPPEVQAATHKIEIDAA